MEQSNTLSIDLLIERSIHEISVLNGLSDQDGKDLIDYYLGLLDSPDYNKEMILKELRKMYIEPNFIRQKLLDVRNLKAYDVGNFSVNTRSSNMPSSDGFKIDIIDVDDGKESQYTGVIPINVNFENFLETQKISEGQSKGKQKILNAHPGIHWEENGFMTFLLVIFLAGISSGIVFMIILNFLSK